MGVYNFFICIMYTVSLSKIAMELQNVSGK